MVTLGITTGLGLRLYFGYSNVKTNFHQGVQNAKETLRNTKLAAKEKVQHAKEKLESTKDKYKQRLEQKKNDWKSKKNKAVEQLETFQEEVSRVTVPQEETTQKMPLNDNKEDKNTARALFETVCQCMHRSVQQTMKQQHHTNKAGSENGPSENDMKEPVENNNNNRSLGKDD